MYALGNATAWTLAKIVDEKYVNPVRLTEPVAKDLNAPIREVAPADDVLLAGIVQIVLPYEGRVKRVGMKAETRLVRHVSALRLARRRLQNPNESSYVAILIIVVVDRRAPQHDRPQLTV
jgi:hypothetical protein